MKRKYDKTTLSIFEKGDDLDSFICDDEEETTKNQNWKREIDKIKKNYHRNPIIYQEGDDDDIQEAKFDDIEREEHRTLQIAEKEDEMEELREKLFYSKKKII